MSCTDFCKCMGCKNILATEEQEEMAIEEYNDSDCSDNE